MISTGSNYNYFWSIKPKRFQRYQNLSNQPGQLHQRAAVTLTWTDCWWANMSTDVQDTLAPPDSANSTITFTRIFIHYLVRYRNIPVIAGEVNRGWSTVPWQHMANLYAKWRMKHVSVTLSIHCHQRCCKRSCQLSGSYSSTQHNNFNFNLNYFGTGIIRNVWPE